MDRALKVTGAAAVAAVAGVGMVGTTASVDAAVVSSGVVNLEIPVTTNGLYLNLITGANNLPGSTAGSTVPGWDINPWSSTGLGFFSPTAPAGGAYVLSATSTVANLAIGATVDGSATFGSGLTSNIAQWNLNSSNNYFGFRFIAEPGGTVHYGWAQIALGSTVNAPGRAIVQYAYESDPNTPITIPIPEPASLGLLAMGAVGLLRRRNKAA